MTASLRSTSKELGVSHEQLRKWQAMPNAPELADIEGWKRFMEANALGRGQGKTFEELRKAKLAKEIELAQIKIDKEARRVIPAEDVRAFDLQYAAKLDAFLKVKLVLEAPNRVNGKSIADTRAELERILDEIRAHLQAGVMKWETEAA